MENNVLERTKSGKVRRVTNPALLHELPRTREAALELGIKRYFTGVPCNHGHVVERRTDNQCCMQCSVLKDAKKRKVEGKPKRTTFKTLEEKKAYTKIKSMEAYERNKDAINERARKFIKDNPESVRAYRLKAQYGISIEEHDTLFFRQGGCCAICKMPPDQKKNHHRLHVDHDHVTGVVRGLLCRDCNLALGLFSDSKHILKSAISYLS